MNCVTWLIADMGELKPQWQGFIQDGIVSELGIAHSFSGGPLRAIREFLKASGDSVVDRHWCELYGRNATSNINGYLKRVK
jgi:cephalosporin hydroxylase